MLAYSRGLPRPWLRALSIGAAVAAGALLGLLALRFPPTVVIAAVVGAALLVVIARAPEVGLLATVLLSVGFVAPESLPQIPFGPFDLNLAEVILFFQVFHVLVNALTRRVPARARTPLGGFVGWFLLAMLLSAVRSVLLASTDLFFVISRVRILLFYAAFFVVTGLIVTPAQVRRLVGGLYAIAIALALAALAGAAFPAFRLSGGQASILATAGRAYEGVLRVTLPGLSLIYLMLVTSFCDLALRGGARWLPGLLRLFVLGAGIVLSFQRNYWISLGLVFGGALALVGRLPRLRLVRAAALCVLIAGLTIGYTEGELARYAAAMRDRLLWGLSSETLAEDRSAQMRLLESGYALESIAEHPLLGIGIGAFYRPAIPEDAYWRESSGRSLRYYVHNAYLAIAVQMGIIGLAPLLLFLGLGLVRGLRGWRRLHGSWERSMVLGISLALAGQMVSNLVSPNMVEAPALVVYPIAIGVVEVILRNAREIEPRVATARGVYE